MAKTIFKRNDPKSIEEARSMEKEEFVKSYMDKYYSSETALSKFWEAQNEGREEVVKEEKPGKKAMKKEINNVSKGDIYGDSEKKPQYYTAPEVGEPLKEMSEEDLSKVREKNDKEKAKAAKEAKKAEKAEEVKKEVSFSLSDFRAFLNTEAKKRKDEEDPIITVLLEMESGEEIKTLFESTLIDSFEEADDEVEAFATAEETIWKAFEDQISKYMKEGGKAVKKTKKVEENPKAAKVTPKEKKPATAGEKTKKERIVDLISENPDIKNKEIKDILAEQGFKCYDSEISSAKKSME